MTAYDIAFAALGVVATGAALLAVTTRHVVHSALWLVLTLGAVAGCFLVLGAEFVALVQLLVYVGAIVVLVLFALMLTRAPIGPSAEHTTSLAHRALAAIVGAGAAALLLAVLLPLAGGPVERRDVANGQLARDLFSTWVWPFELLSVLLLGSLVAAFAVSRLIRPEVESAGGAS
ncbi:MAG: NADH-quinone oxidoreductase subunit J [Nostocoides sp.]